MSHFNLFFILYLNVLNKTEERRKQSTQDNNGSKLCRVN